MCLHSSLGPAGKQGRTAHLFHTVAQDASYQAPTGSPDNSLDAAYLEAVITAC